MTTRRIRALAIGGAVVAVGGLAAGRLLRRYLIATVSGPSMEPTLRSGDRLLVLRGPQARTRARAGRIVVVRVPDPPTLDRVPPEAADLTDAQLAALPYRPDLDPSPGGRLLVKRVLAAAGDPIPRDRVPALRDVPETVVPAGALVVLGDNPTTSWDSRDYGYVHRSQFVGVAVRRLR
ncbi:S26 family signal peptidase [Streptomyces sp. SID3343]|uniref:S26 family signal peptidase n=1 Tax=Streptomyces sp. SID3343 TaxID=2690260 RepID=UPI00136EE28F|nr:S26 family signal peptidase [Streptomyces sp. SID3343]MYW05910.1 S26 family signal peptidase [Streptomyces sp. SID3343]